jgi:hypothetical protein
MDFENARIAHNGHEDITAGPVYFHVPDFSNAA